MEEKEVQGAPVHKRRVRYSGTHPKRFEEKYKEQNPEKYADTVEKVIKKGSTPAGISWISDRECRGLTLHWVTAGTQRRC